MIAWLRSLMWVAAAVNVLAGGPDTASDRVRQALDAGQYDLAEQLAARLVDGAAGPSDQLGAERLLIRALVANGRGAAPRTRALAEQLARLPGSPEDRRSLGDVRYESGDYAQAVAAHRQALDACDAARVAGCDSSEYLDRVGRDLVRLGKFDEAQAALARALRLKEARASRGDAGVARTLQLMATVEQRRGAYIQARRLLERAREVRGVDGAAHPDFVEIENTWGDQFAFEDRLEEAITAYRRALDIAGQTLRPDHPDVALTLRKLSSVLTEIGSVRDARSLRERAVSIAESNLGDRHPLLAGYINDLANTFWAEGDYASAQRLYERALAMYEDTVGPMHIDTATEWHNLAILNATIGSYAEARRLHDRAVSIWSTQLGPNHPFVGRAYSALGGALAEQGLYRESRLFLERGLKIREASLGSDHADVAVTLATLAKTYAELGLRPLAESAVDRALDIWAHAPATAQADSATEALMLRGFLRFTNGNRAGARDDFARAVDIRQRVFGSDHPASAEAEAALSRVLFATGDPSANDRALHAETVARHHLRTIVRYLSTRQSLSYRLKRAAAIDAVLSMVTTGAVDAAVVDAVIRGRGLVADEMANRARARDSDPGVQLASARLAVARQRLANLVVRGPSGSHADQYVRLVDQATRDADTAERALADASVGSADPLRPAEAGLETIVRAMPDRAALVSFARFNSRTTMAGGVSGAAYVAFVVRPGSAPSAVRIGPAVRVDAAVDAWRRAVLQFGNDAAEPVVPPEYRSVATALRRLVWDPLVPYLGDASVVFVVPDGSLNFVNLAALPIGTRRFVLEEARLLHYLSAERDLISVQPLQSSGGLLAVGGADFGTRPATGTDGERATANCASLSTARFDDLPGTRAELSDIAALWSKESNGPVQLLTGRAATETAVKKAMVGRRIVHLATHGFFLSPDCVQAPAGTRAVGGIAPQHGHHDGSATDNPLLLSGIALARANLRRAASSTGDDGILTAEEVAGIDLQGVEWAVLSACDTGVGEVRTGEGVFGLRRAFQIAGARTVIMSLWSVDDQATRDWMRALYRNRLERGLSTADSVREASLSVLRARRARGLSTHPFYWGGFVAAGDWR